MTVNSNQNGEIAFGGFYGDYEAEIGGKAIKFGVHKNCDNIIEIEI